MENVNKPTINDILEKLEEDGALEMQEVLKNYVSATNKMLSAYKEAVKRLADAEKRHNGVKSVLAEIVKHM